MDIFTRDAVLKTFEILVDTREQPTKQSQKRYDSFEVQYKRVTLSYGDYAYNAILPNGKPIYDVSTTIHPICVVERKMNLDELAGCYTSSRQRFQKEFERAKEHHCRIYLICENANWENLMNGKYRSRFHQNAFTASAVTWMVRYNMNIIFCKEETSGKLIKEILYRDLKERLEGGEFDGDWMD